jgi:hypothetical protein
LGWLWFDFEVKLNDKILLLKNLSSYSKLIWASFFSALLITAQVKNTGSGVYNLSRLDLGT